MKAKVLVLFISIACAPSVCLFGQVDCTNSTKLACEFPVSAQTLGQYTVGNPAISRAAATANAINASIATQLTQLPIPSATVGTVTVVSKENPLGVPFDNLGPIVVDRPDTIGKKNYFIGFSYQHFDFNAIDGVPFAKIPVGYSFSQPSPFNPNDLRTFYGSENNSVSFTLNQLVGVLTYGLTKTTDVSVIVPINSVNLSVVASGFQGFYYDQAQQAYTIIPTQATSVTSTGSKGGIGDVTLTFKQLILGGEGSHTAIAAGVAFRLPTGDSLDYLGAGALGANVYGIVEYRARVAPHIKLSYQYNDVSQLTNLDAPPTTALPGGLQYDMGADIRVKPYLTFAGDFLGSQFVNAPSFLLTSPPISTIVPVGGLPSGIPSSIPGVTALNNTYTTANVSGGVKLAYKHFLFYGNVLKQVNNVGLRSGVVPLVGIAFKK